MGPLMNHKVLSICIPTYNRAIILKNTLSNLVLQDISRVEIIISDNASTDETYEVVKEFDDYGINYYCNSKNQGFTYNLIKVMEYANTDYLTLVSDEDDVNVNNILASIDELTSSSVGVILGTVLTSEKEVVRSFKTEIKVSSFRTFYSYGFKVASMSGIVFKRSNIDFTDLWREFNSSPSYGFLDVYPHVYVFNRILLENDLATDKRIFAMIRERGIHYPEKINGLGYFHPLNRFEQLKKKLLFVKKYSQFNFFESRLLVFRLLRLFKDQVISYTKFNEEIKSYFAIGSTEGINLKQFLSDSFIDLQNAELIIFLDKWILGLFVIVRYFYRILKFIYIKIKICLSK
jgi:glycosyltransferase involved in cell wall biosynthesis